MSFILQRLFDHYHYQVAAAAEKEQGKRDESGEAPSEKQDDTPVVKSEPKCDTVTEQKRPELVLLPMPLPVTMPLPVSAECRLLALHPSHCTLLKAIENSVPGHKALCPGT